MQSAPENAETDPTGTAPLVVVVTGMSGAGRTTAIKVLEDLGYEAINNLPLTFFDALIAPVAGTSTPIAVGVETRTRGFSANALPQMIERLREDWGIGVLLVYLDCSDAQLFARFSETRRPHPLALAEDVATGIARERDLLSAVRERADAIIDTTGLTPHELRADFEARFALDRWRGLSVTIQSFAYKRGVPHGADMVLDCRFLRNPYWEDALRALDGRDSRIQGFVHEDPLYAAFYDRLVDMVKLLLPAYRAEGKAYFTVALGCTGGRHRSVTVAEHLARGVEDAGWPVSIRHRELDGRG